MAESVIKKDPLLTSVTPTNLVGGGGTIAVYKYGRILIISLQGIFNNIGTTYTKICDLPDGFLPFTNQYQESYSAFSNDRFNVYISAGNKSISISRQNTTGNLTVYEDLVCISQ